MYNNNNNNNDTCTNNNNTIVLKHFQASLTEAVEEKALEDEALAFLLEEEDREKESLRAATTTTHCSKVYCFPGAHSDARLPTLDFLSLPGPLCLCELCRNCTLSTSGDSSYSVPAGPLWCLGSVLSRACSGTCKTYIHVCKKSNNFWNTAASRHT